MSFYEYLNSVYQCLNSVLPRHNNYFYCKYHSHNLPTCTLQWALMSHIVFGIELYHYEQLQAKHTVSTHKSIANRDARTQTRLSQTSTKTQTGSPTFSSFSKCSRRNFIGRSGLAMQRFTMHSFRICWMLCFCTKISQPFKLSSSSRVEEEEVAILSFIPGAVGEQGEEGESGDGGWGGERGGHGGKRLE